MIEKQDMLAQSDLVDIPETIQKVDHVYESESFEQPKLDFEFSASRLAIQNDNDQLQQTHNLNADNVIQCNQIPDSQHYAQPSFPDPGSGKALENMNKNLVNKEVCSNYLSGDLHNEGLFCPDNVPRKRKFCGKEETDTGMPIIVNDNLAY